MRDGLIGFIDTPAQGNIRPAGVAWCADNGCFGKGYPGDAKWFAWLKKNASDAGSCWFATAPDVVGDAAATLARSAPWLAQIRALGYPVALVGQNGLQDLAVPWDQFDVLFIGGCPECPSHGPTLSAVTTGTGRRQRLYCPECLVEIYDWKESRHVVALAAEAKRRGKGLHMGRVNGGDRFGFAAAIGCDSADGTTLAKFPRTLKDVLAWSARHHAQPSLINPGGVD